MNQQYIKKTNTTAILLVIGTISGIVMGFSIGAVYGVLPPEYYTNLNIVKNATITTLEFGDLEAAYGLEAEDRAKLQDKYILKEVQDKPLEFQLLYLELMNDLDESRITQCETAYHLAQENINEIIECSLELDGWEDTLDEYHDKKIAALDAAIERIENEKKLNN